MEPKYLLIVKVEAGLVILDKPITRTKGAREVSPAVPAGTPLEAYRIVPVGGTPYAWLVPNPPIVLRPPYKTAWCRVKDADLEYVDVIDLASAEEESSSLANAFTLLANAITILATEIHNWARGKQ